MEWGVNTVSASSPYGLTDFSSEYTPKARENESNTRRTDRYQGSRNKMADGGKKGGKRGWRPLSRRLQH